MTLQLAQDVIEQRRVHGTRFNGRHVISFSSKDGIVGHAGLIDEIGRLAQDPMHSVICRVNSDVSPLVCFDNVANQRSAPDILAPGQHVLIQSGLP